MKNILIRFFVVALFLALAIFIIANAPQYELEYKYKNDDLRVIINDKEITQEIKRLPEVAIYKNGEIMLSSNTIDILFDKDLYFEEKKDIFITTCNNHRADIEIGSRTMKVDGKDVPLKEPAFKVVYDYSEDYRYEDSNTKKDVYYIPLSPLVGVYDIVVEFPDKVVITTKGNDIKQFIVKDDETINLKYLEDGASKTIDTARAGDVVYVFNYDENETYSKVRSMNGEIGYIGNDIIKNYSFDVVSSKPVVPAETTEPITLAWDYINPLHSTIGDKKDRAKVNAIDVVSPTILYLENSNGKIYYNTNVLKEYLAWAKSCNYQVWITLKNERIYDNKPFTIDDTSDFLNDIEHRSRAISELIKICKDNNIPGIDIDFENIYQTDATAFSQFIRELGVECKNNNITLCVCVNIPDGSPTWSLCYQHKALAEVADYLAVMTYDYRSVNNDISAFAPYTWVEDNIKKLVQRDNVPAEKFLLGISFGSAYWKDKTRSIIYMGNANRFKGKATWDDELHQYIYKTTNTNEIVFIENKDSIKEKLKLIDKYNLGGSGAWVLGQESSDVWEAYEK